MFFFVFWAFLLLLHHRLYLLSLFELLWWNALRLSCVMFFYFLMPSVISDELLGCMTSAELDEWFGVFEFNYALCWFQAFHFPTWCIFGGCACSLLCLLELVFVLYRRFMGPIYLRRFLKTSSGHCIKMVSVFSLKPQLLCFVVWSILQIHRAGKEKREMQCGFCCNNQVWDGSKVKLAMLMDSRIASSALVIVEIGLLGEN